jgi:hypothetical protein
MPGNEGQGTSPLFPIRASGGENGLFVSETRLTSHAHRESASMIELYGLAPLIWLGYWPATYACRPSPWSVISGRGIV